LVFLPNPLLFDALELYRLTSLSMPRNWACQLLL
jgi:hypothetical protein